MTIAALFKYKASERWNAIADVKRLNVYNATRAQLLEVYAPALLIAASSLVSTRELRYEVIKKIDSCVRDGTLSMLAASKWIGISLGDSLEAYLRAPNTYKDIMVEQMRNIILTNIAEHCPYCGVQRLSYPTPAHMCIDDEEIVLP